MRSLLLASGLAAFAAVASAQSPLTTIYTGGNGLGAASTIYFDVVVNVPLTFLQIDVNSSSAANTTGSLDVRWCPSTYVGNDANAAAWTLGGSGPVTAAGNNLPTPCTLTPFTLAPGNYGIAVTFNGIGQNYTNGTGTTVPGSGTNQTYSTTELTLLAGASAGGAPGTAICCVPRVFNGSIHYSVGGSGTVATRTNYGTGCVARASSFYEHFVTTPSIDLSNTAFSMLNTGTGYIVVPSNAAFVPPSGTAQNLNLGDDTQATVALASPFAFPGGSTSSLVVCSNGFVSAVTGNGTSFTPSPVAFLAWPQAAWAVWRDFICNATGNVFFEQVGGIAYITWNGVIGYVGTAPGTVTSTFQFQFNLANGSVDFVFQSMDTVSVSTWAGGEGWVVGYSPGGPSLNPGSIDITTALPLTLPGGDLAALALSASARPLAGATINLDTANITPTAPFGAVLLSLTQFNPGLDLTGLGMAGCSQFTGGDVTLLFVPVGAATNSQPLLVPNAIGIHIYAQSVVYDPAAGLTLLGAIASNGVDLGIGNL